MLSEIIPLASDMCTQCTASPKKAQQSCQLFLTSWPPPSYHPKIPLAKQVLINTHTMQRAHYYGNVRIENEVTAGVHTMSVPQEHS